MYHRIMFCMSLADIIASVAMALTTIPMPKDMIYTQFEPKAYGTTTTCSIQGFFFTLGSTITFGYNALLCFYYLCAIRYKMKDSKFRNRVEPWLHFVCLASPLQYSIIYLFGKTYNPSPIEAWCTTTVYPLTCGFRSESDKDCVTRNVNAFVRRYGTMFALINFVLGFGILVGSMTLIIWSVYRQERLLNAYVKKVYGRRQQRQQHPQQLEDGVPPAAGQDEGKNLASSRSRHHLTKVILYQALAYVFAFLICQGNVFVSLAQNADRTRIFRTNTGAQIYHLVTRPLQGFLNFIVFLGHKVYNLRQVRQDMSICQAIWHVMIVREEPRFIFSRISLVANSGREGDEILFDGDDDNQDDEVIDQSREDTGGNKSKMHTSTKSIDNLSVASTNKNPDRKSDAQSASNLSFTEDKFQDDSVEKDGFSSFGPASWFSSKPSAKSGYNDRSSISFEGALSWQTFGSNDSKG